MAFSVEDGSQVPTANAYAAIADITAYLTDRGRLDSSGWSAANQSTQEAAIVRATDYINKRWGSRFRGTRRSASSVQGLPWPRVDACDDSGFEYAEDEIPARLIQATAEYSVRALSGDLISDPTAVGASTIRDIKRKIEKVGPLEESTEYFGAAEAATSGLSPDVTPYPAADLLMLELVTSDPIAQGGVQFGRIVRA